MYNSPIEAILLQIKLENIMNTLNTMLVVTTATGVHHAPTSDLNNILMVMADCKTDMVAHMTKMVMNWHTVARNGMHVMMVLEEDLI